MSFFEEIMKKGFEAVMRSLVDESVTAFEKMIGWVSAQSINVLDISVVTEGILYTQGLALALLGTKVAFESWVTYQLRLNGDPDADPGGLLMTTMSAVAVIGSIPWILRQMYTFGMSILYDITQLPGVSQEEGGGVLLHFIDGQSGQIGAILALAIIAAIIITIFISFQSFIRAIELGHHGVIGSMMALGLTNSNTYGTWWRELVAMSLTPAYQMFGLKLCFALLERVAFNVDPYVSIALFIAALYVTYKGPSFIKRYAYSTGLGGAVGSGVKTAGNLLAMRFIRR